MAKFTSSPTSIRVRSQSAGTLLTTFELKSSIGGSALPFAFGHCFKEGDIPSGRLVSANSSQIVDFDCSVRNTWPDGSIKFALLSGHINLAPNSYFSLNLVLSDASSSNLPLSTAQLRATGVTAGISFGNTSVQWSAADWETPQSTIQRGSSMSSWTYRKPLGSDAHLVAWLEVRLYKGGNVEILPWIENGYLNVANPTVKSGRAIFQLGGQSRYDSINEADYTSPYNVEVIKSGAINMAHHTRAALISGGKHSHWLKTDPQMVPKYNRLYLESTLTVPSYRAAKVNESALAALTSHYSPMNVSYLDKGMGTTGYNSTIGLLTNNCALWLVSGDARAFKAVMAEGFSLASYCIHYRDETTQKPLVFAQYPTLTGDAGGTFLPAVSGDQPHRYAMSHHPAAAYLPYLTSGWNWFVEEIQFQVTSHYIGMTPQGREGINFFFTGNHGLPGHNNQGGPRAYAWCWRTCGMAASITPDADALRAPLVQALGYNAQRWRRIHETSGDARAPWAPNSLGLMFEPGYNGQTTPILMGSWQDDFMTMSIGLIWDLQVITDTARRADLKWFRDFKYKSIVGRLGQQNVLTDWNYQYAGQYQIYVGVGTGNASVFNWYSNWGEAFAAYMGKNNSGYGGTDIRISKTEPPDPVRSEQLQTGYWGNLQPAIAYAVDHGASGAKAAYDRMVKASNYQTASLGYEQIPGWGIKPRTISG